MSKSLPSDLLIATLNTGKLREIRTLLAALPVRLRSLRDFPSTSEVEETGSTFAENAALKATAYAQQAGLWTVADDSGLEVYALGGAPGVFSARYAGANASDAERIELLLNELNKTGDTARRARFVCVIALANPEGEIINLHTGLCEGHITDRPRGTHGFGYDPVFIPDGYQETFGELSREIKESISHRARALRAAHTSLLKIFRTLD